MATNDIKNTFPTSYVSVDTETTGLFPKYGDRIIQLSAVKYINDKQVDTFNRYIDPDGVNNWSESINNISDDDLVGQPTIDKVLPSFVDFVGNLPWLGHNLNFDFRFLQNEGLNVGKYKEHYLDTLKLARRAFHNKHNKLWMLEKRFNITNDHQHLSLDDAIATAEVYQQLRSLVPPEKEHHNNRRTYKKHIVATAEDNSLGGLRILFTGHFEEGTRDELRTYVEKHGGKAPTSISKSTDYLVVGDQTSKTKYDGHSSKEVKAMKYGTNIISIDELIRMSETGEE